MSFLDNEFLAFFYQSFCYFICCKKTVFESFVKALYKLLAFFFSSSSLVTVDDFLFDITHTKIK